MNPTGVDHALIARLGEGEGALTVSSLPHGLDALVLAALAAENDHPIIHVARDDLRAREIMDVLAFFAPQVDVVFIPGWDCQPYDRVSPNGAVTAARLAALSRLAMGQIPQIILTTVNAALQRVVPRAVLQGERFELSKNGQLSPDTLTRFLDRTGFARASTVMEPGDYAVRGGLIDLYAPGSDLPVRIDFFGDEIDSIRTFDPATQRSQEALDKLVLAPMSDVRLDEASIARFRQGYVSTFGAVTDDDPLYEAVSAGRRHQGMEHWLPLYHDHLETLFDYVPAARLSLDALAAEAIEARFTTIGDYYQARVDDGEAKVKAATGTFQVPAYKPLPPDALYLTREDWAELAAARGALSFSTFDEPPGDSHVSAGGKAARSFAAERAQEGVNVYEAVKDYLAAEITAGNRVMIASWSEGARDRLSHVLMDHGVKPVDLVDSGSAMQALPQATVALAVLPMETGFRAKGLTVLSEQDILGDRLVRGAEKRRRAENFLTEASSLSAGDLVVHVDHGIGRYLGLETIEVLGAPHDCLRLEYAGENTLFLPVENIELLSRYGSDSESIQLDKLGGVAWQNRKARLKGRLKDMAEELMKIAARREMRKMPVIAPPAGSYDEFAAAFPYQETEDQARAIDDVIDDFAKGRPMDRLVCGDVGFGKTEVALRAAFVMAMSGRQVAIVVPTTLLARQHYATLKDRLRGWPLKLGQLSRLVPAKEQTETKKLLAEGQIDIVVGTHSLLHKAIDFKDLGLLLIDEEQHFGVRHKERLKELKSDIHVLTLTATPIPRTLQLAMTGVRDLSLIATPPVDRLAVRTFVAPMDPVTIREALLREHYRGGQ
ncbi:MAG: transcription-repair coupling factor, partial [Alphaproteobacteria bacterium]